MCLRATACNSGVTYYECSGSTCAPVPMERLVLPADPNAPSWPDVLVLLGMLLALRTAVYMVLRRKTKARQRNIGE